MKILRDQPNTLQGVVGIATNEKDLRVRVQMSYQSYSSNNTHTQVKIYHSKGQRFKLYKEHSKCSNAAKSKMLAL